MKPYGVVPLVVGLVLVGGAASAQRTPLPTEGPTVAVIVGEDTIPLGVRERFQDIAGKVLPTPGLLPVEDAHERGHGVHHYCYSFDGGFLRFVDWPDFGMHSAEMTREAPADNVSCPTLESEPAFRFGDLFVALGDPVSELVVRLADRYEWAASGPIPPDSAFEAEWVHRASGDLPEIAACVYGDASIWFRSLDAQVVRLSLRHFEEHSPCPENM